MNRKKVSLHLRWDRAIQARDARRAYRCERALAGLRTHRCDSARTISRTNERRAARANHPRNAPLS